jgi:hypothetical protein
MTDVIIEIEDINDHAPQFPVNIVRLEVSEDATINSSVPLIHAEDMDKGRFGIQAYSLSSAQQGSSNIGAQQLGPFLISVSRAEDGRQKVRRIV